MFSALFEVKKNKVGIYVIVAYDSTSNNSFFFMTRFKIMKKIGVPVFVLYFITYLLILKKNVS